MSIKVKTLEKHKSLNWRKLGFEFLSIFIAITSALALDNWNENRRDRNTEQIILREISNGLRKDLDDIGLNITGHKEGIEACVYWRKATQGQEIDTTKLRPFYVALTRDFISIQNTSGYETLKSKGLELITNDALRFEIISLYEHDFSTLRKLEEEYSETQFHASHFTEINQLISPSLVFDSIGQIVDVIRPLNLGETDKKKFLSYLWMIEMNRKFVLHHYALVEKRVKQLHKKIEDGLRP